MDFIPSSTINIKFVEDEFGSSLLRKSRTTFASSSIISNLPKTNLMGRFTACQQKKQKQKSFNYIKRFFELGYIPIQQV